MATKKTERIMFYDEKLHRWMVDTMELEEEREEESQGSDERENKSEKHMLY